MKREADEHVVQGAGVSGLRYCELNDATIELTPQLADFGTQRVYVGAEALLVCCR